MTRDLPAPAAGLMVALERMRRLSNRFSRALQAGIGASMYEVGTLAAIEDGARRLHEVAEATGQQVSGASRMVDRLVREGLLQRDADPADRRAVVLALTAAGAAQLAEARRLLGGVVDDALARMPSDSARDLLPALSRFLDAAEAVLDDEPLPDKASAPPD